MANIRTLKLNLLADVTQFSKGLESSQTKFKKWGQDLSRLSTQTAVAVGAIAYASKDAINSASDLNESLSKSAVVFQDQSTAIEEFAKTAAKSFGLSQRQALDGAATFALFGKQAGLTGKKLTSFSTDLVGLASDLASFNNTTTDEALVALAAGLRGEAEPLRRFNILLSANAVEQKAVQMGLANTKAALTEQDKVLARNALIMEQSTIQQGDFARTADGAANQQRILAADVENLKAKIGQGLLPVFKDLLKFVNNTVLPAFQKFGEFVANNQALVKGFAIVLGTFVVVLGAVTAAVWLLNTALFANPIGLFVAGVAAAVAGVGYLITKLRGAAKETSNLSMQSRDLARSNGRNAATVKPLADSLGNYTVKLPKATKGIKELTKAQKELAKSKTAFDDYKKSIKDTLDQQLSFASAFENKGKGSFLESLRKQADAARVFASKIGQLLAAGLSKAGIQQVISAGVTTGTQIANELLGGGRGAISEANTLLSATSQFNNQAAGTIAGATVGGQYKGNTFIFNGVIDGQSAARTIEKLLQDSARRTGAISLAGATL